MAINTWVAAGASTWNVAGNWSLGHAPLAGEDVVLDGTSVFNCTVNTITPGLASFTVADTYTGTLAFNATAEVVSVGSIYLGTGCLYSLGANSCFTMNPSGAATLTTNGCVLVILKNSAVCAGSITLADPLTTSGAVSLNQSSFDQNGKAIASAALYVTPPVGATATLDAAMTISGGVTFNARCTVTGALTITNTATLTGGGATLQDVTFNAAGKNLMSGSALIARTLTILAGDVFWFWPITLSGNAILGGATLNLSTSTITLTGNAVTLRISATTRTTSNATFVHSGTSATLDLANAGNTTIKKLDLLSGSTYTWAATANVLTISTPVAADFNGQTWRSGTPGTPYHFDPSGALTVTGMNVTDCHNTNAADIDATAASNTNGGGNDGWLFPAVPVPVTDNVHDITKAFCRLMFTPLVQSGKAWMVCNTMGSGRAVWIAAWDAMDDHARPGDTAADTEMRQWLFKVFRSTIGVSVQGASAPVLPYMGGAGTRAILPREMLGEAVRYSQMV